MRQLNCILLVEDNPADNYYSRYIIKEAKICDHVEVAINGIEALAYLKKSEEQSQNEHFPHPDIIFLDINMPRMNGFEFLAEYEKLGESIKSRSLMVILTTSMNPEDRKNAMAFKEVREFQSKPLSEESLDDIMEMYFS